MSHMYCQRVCHFTMSILSASKLGLTDYHTEGFFLYLLTKGIENWPLITLSIGFSRTPSPVREDLRSMMGQTRLGEGTWGHDLFCNSAYIPSGQTRYLQVPDTALSMYVQNM